MESKYEKAVPNVGQLTREEAVPTGSQVKYEKALPTGSQLKQVKRDKAVPNGNQLWNNRYRHLDKLGSGTYGVVYKAKDTKTGDLVAIKKIALSTKEEGIPTVTLRELAALTSLNHKNIVRMLDVFVSRGRLFLVFEYLELDLYQYLRAKEGIVSPALIRKYMHQLLLAVAHCHENGVLHRDLKPQNLLLLRDGTLKVADFGLSRGYSLPLPKYTRDVVTLWFRPPEMILQEGFTVKYSTSMDMWGVGCIFGQLLNYGNALFPADSEIDLLHRIFKLLGTPTEQTWPGVTSFENFSSDFPHWFRRDFVDVFCLVEDVYALDLLERMLVYNPRDRISAKDALAHPYFRKNTLKISQQVTSEFIASRERRRQQQGQRMWGKGQGAPAESSVGGAHGRSPPVEKHVSEERELEPAGPVDMQQTTPGMGVMGANPASLETISHH